MSAATILIATEAVLPNFLVIKKKTKSLLVLPFDLKYKYPARNSARVSLSKLLRSESANPKNEGDVESLSISLASESLSSDRPRVSELRGNPLMRV